MTIFGECLFELRRKRKLMQKELAALAQLDATYLTGLEKGKRLPPRAQILERIIVALSATEAEAARLRNAADATSLMRTMQGLHHFDGLDILLRLTEAMHYMSRQRLGTFISEIADLIATKHANDESEFSHERNRPTTQHTRNLEVLKTK